MLKTALSISLLSATLFFTSGCMSHQGGNFEVAEMNSDVKYSIGKTTLEDVQNELGATPFIFEKSNGDTKYVYESHRNSIGFGSHRGNRNTLALTFNKKNILTSKSFHNGSYMDPDIAKMVSKMMQNPNMYKGPRESMSY